MKWNNDVAWFKLVNKTYQKPKSQSKFDPIIEEEEDKAEKSRLKYSKVVNESYEGGEEEESKM